MWIAAKNNPFYNSVEEFETEEEASIHANKWIQELNENNGHHECYVYVCEVKERRSIKTYY